MTERRAKEYDEAVAIAAAHPLMTGDHDRYARAQAMVFARHSKGDLVDLVNWLLMRAEEAECRS